MDYRLEQVADGVPAWDILFGGKKVGLLTDLPAEGTPMATVRCVNGYELTVKASTVEMCAATAFEAHDVMMEALVIEWVGC